jgi:hypothetical protein
MAVNEVVRYWKNFSETIRTRTTRIPCMFQSSTLFFKPVLLGILPSLIIWAAVMPVALKLN